ncbi:hypothetical protein [Schaalia suimastitidis]|uniref:hypothetical protein n=1 Tax=Schaalia suimastitidis TaxID=121163 RepID=UPI0004171EC6|nr:hypothetical protein [Schaalia suimastitidis]
MSTFGPYRNDDESSYEPTFAPFGHTSYFDSEQDLLVDDDAADEAYIPTKYPSPSFLPVEQTNPASHTSVPTGRSAPSAPRAAKPQQRATTPAAQRPVSSSPAQAPRPAQRQSAPRPNAGRQRAATSRRVTTSRGAQSPRRNRYPSTRQAKQLRGRAMLGVMFSVLAMTVTWFGSGGSEDLLVSLGLLPKNGDYAVEYAREDLEPLSGNSALSNLEIFDQSSVALSGDTLIVKENDNKTINAYDLSSGTVTPLWTFVDEYHISGWRTNLWQGYAVVGGRLIDINTGQLSDTQPHEHTVSGQYVCGDILVTQDFTQLSAWRTPANRTPMWTVLTNASQVNLSDHPPLIIDGTCYLLLDGANYATRYVLNTEIGEITPVTFNVTPKETSYREVVLSTDAWGLVDMTDPQAMRVEWIGVQGTAIDVFTAIDFIDYSRPYALTYGVTPTREDYRLRWYDQATHGAFVPLAQTDAGCSPLQYRGVTLEGEQDMCDIGQAMTTSDDTRLITSNGIYDTHTGQLLVQFDDGGDFRMLSDEYMVWEYGVNQSIYRIPSSDLVELPAP